MATPMSPNTLVSMLRAEGVKVVEHRSWRTNNRNSKGAWGPVHGVMIHHTVTSGAKSSVDLCYRGHSTLPGPLCHGVIAKDGTVYLVGNGRANHAGGGDPNVLRAVIDERYTTRPPAPHQHQGSEGAVDGNAHFYGFECVNLGDGKDPWPAAQIDAITRVSAAISRFHKWSARSVIGNLEWSDHKSDPRGFTMPALRGKIAERLTHPASWGSVITPPKPKPSPGAPMTAPNRTVLSRAEDVQLIPDDPYTVYFTTEHLDDASGHGDGGKTVGTNIRYDGTLYLQIDGLESGEAVEVYPAEESTANGARIGNGDPVTVHGQGGDGAWPVKVAVPVTGTVGQRLVFEVVNRQETPVTLTFARLSLQSWPNA